MPRPRFLLLAVTLSASCATTNPTTSPSAPDRLIELDGRDAMFAEGRKSFPHSKERCFGAVLATFKNTGHGVDRQDAGSGRIISGKITVYRGTSTLAKGVSATEVDNRFYVSVRGDDTSCEVSVEKLRAWSGTVEVATRTSSWTRAQLHGFLRGVEQELVEASWPNGAPSR